MTKSYFMRILDNGKILIRDNETGTPHFVDSISKISDKITEVEDIKLAETEAEIEKVKLVEMKKAKLTELEEKRLEELESKDKEE